MDAQGIHNDTFGEDDYYAYGGGVAEAPPMVTGADYDISDIVGGTGGAKSSHWHIFVLVLAGVGAITLLYKFGVRGIAAA